MVANGDEKDRLGDKLRDVERAREDQYFAERDRKLVADLQRAKGEIGANAASETGQTACPKCATTLQRHVHDGVTVEECPSCHGMWLDHGQQQAVARNEDQGWIARWLRSEFRKAE